MGNICGKTESDPFSQPGRTVGAAPASGPQSSSIPAKAKSKQPKVSGPGRTLGGSSGQAPEEARSKAAQAAEVSRATLPYRFATWSQKRRTDEDVYEITGPSTGRQQTGRQAAVPAIGAEETDTHRHTQGGEQPGAAHARGRGRREDEELGLDTISVGELGVHGPTTYHESDVVIPFYTSAMGASNDVQMMKGRSKMAVISF